MNDSNPFNGGTEKMDASLRYRMGRNTKECPVRKGSLSEGALSLLSHRKTKCGKNCGVVRG
jgi:hypothetical protein